MVKEYLKTNKPSVMADPKEPFPILGTSKRLGSNVAEGDKMWVYKTKKGK